jgi:hypothetical protein
VLTPAAEAALKSAQQRFPFGVSSPVDGLTCHPADPLQLVAWNRSGSAWHSTDGAKTWQASPVQGGPTTSAAATRAWWGVKGKLVFIPATFNDHVGSLSEDGGKTFRVIVRPTAIENSASVHQPAKITLYDRAMLANGELVAIGVVATDSGQGWTILSSPDRGKTWIGRMVATSMIWSLFPTSVGLLVAAHDPAGGGGGMRLSADLGRTWTPFTGLYGQFMHFGMLSCASGNVTVVVDGTSRISCVYDFTEKGMVDAVREFLPIAVPTGEVLRIDAFAIDPLDPKLWYCAGPRIGLLRSLDQGQTWKGYALPGIVPAVGRSSLSFTAGPAPRLVLSTGNDAIIIQDRLHDSALFPTPLPATLGDPPKTGP